MEEQCKIVKKQPKIAVLMSAYNGEKYIREQLDSIINQTYKNIDIYVRDDGSTDSTLNILKEYEAEKKIILLLGKNMGFINSFFQVLKECGKADYYAWCDQDDVWKSQKIARAVYILEKDKRKNAKEMPVLYFSDYDFYDENMNFQKHGLIHKRGPSFQNSLMDCISLGFNSVFNQQARKMMVENLPDSCCGHDWWTYMVCAAFGRVLYDRGYVSVCYRRLEQSVSPGGKSFIAMQVWRFKKFFLNDYFASIRKQLQCFYDLYEKQLDGKNKKIIQLFAIEKYSMQRAVKKAFYPVFFRQGIVEEIMVRLLFLIGKL